MKKDMKRRLRDYGIVIGSGKPGKYNKITDVPGVLVGHRTIDTDNHKTGVTVIMPCEDNMFSRKLTAATYVHNGFGKTAGLVQIQELGTLETPIALTNTLNVGRVQDAMVGYMLERCLVDGITVHSINPVVGECNDSSLNDITERIVGEDDVKAAIDSACVDFEEGDVGAGKGTVCFGLKGGIGSASRIVEAGGRTFTIGVLVQSNFGSTEQLMVNGEPVGRTLMGKIKPAAEDKGSIMMIVATDLPVSDRQLYRIIRRAGVGLARCGSYMGHGSGDIMIGFTTANRVPPESSGEIRTMEVVAEGILGRAFTAAAEATEEAILNSLAAAGTVTGYTGETRRDLTSLYLEPLMDKKG